MIFQHLCAILYASPKKEKKDEAYKITQPFAVRAFAFAAYFVLRLGALRPAL